MAPSITTPHMMTIRINKPSRMATSVAAKYVPFCLNLNPNAIVQNVIMLSVIAPFRLLQRSLTLSFQIDPKVFLCLKESKDFG
jgi:hypothetical protein